MTRPPFPENVETREQVGDLERYRAERGPFDFRDADEVSWRRYGQAGTTLMFAVIGPLGAVSVGLFLDDAPGGHRMGRTMGAAVGWHYPDPSLDYEESDCLLLPEGKCRPETSYLAADEPTERYDQGGEDAVWSWLENEYRSTFERKDDDAHEHD